ncbi:uncharacterized protein A1O5_07448 [Cladophialophora psammophila CBS 110553]|uniref:Uncharacterized protein n=1 Tax=Cladophialophora psammophila CBS 110553 TaxID=1182543 RepID=W9WMM6_9EURO|nr:uncharacterized protein A1O5_07448 [Cladophialophora psammophila CBS 110553]EXJ69412.1 hypothetical protein A1O5_07448 [Cladophialophora psammophila CBS 110553]
MQCDDFQPSNLLLTARTCALLVLSIGSSLTWDQLRLPALRHGSFCTKGRSIGSLTFTSSWCALCHGFVASRRSSRI